MNATKVFIIIILCTVLVLTSCTPHVINEECTVVETDVMSVNPIKYQFADVEPLTTEELVEEGKTSDEDVTPTLPIAMAAEKGTTPNKDVTPIVHVTTVEEEDKISDEDIALIALVTMAEAEGESEEGQRFVISTILNRVDSEYFPDSVHDVIYQKNQFSSMWNGRVERCEVREDIYQLVREELQSRSNYEVVFFTAGTYSKYGVPMFRVGNHYFSSYD